MSNDGKLLTVVVFLLLLIGAIFGIMHVMTDKVANRVIQKLEKEYCPSPYGSGFDPDKVQIKPKTSGPASQAPANPLLQPSTPPAKTWNEDWEESRR